MININTTIEIQTVTTKTITQARTTFLGNALEKEFALLVFEYLDETGAVAKKRFFKVSGSVYDQHVDTNINNETYRGWSKAAANAFAMELINTPAMIDGVEVIEMNNGKFMGEVSREIIM